MSDVRFYCQETVGWAWPVAPPSADHGGRAGQLLHFNWQTRQRAINTSRPHPHGSGGEMCGLWMAGPVWCHAGVFPSGELVLVQEQKIKHFSYRTDVSISIDTGIVAHFHPYFISKYIFWLFPYLFVCWCFFYGLNVAFLIPRLLPARGWGYPGSIWF